MRKSLRALFSLYPQVYYFFIVSSYMYMYTDQLFWWKPVLGGQQCILLRVLGESIIIICQYGMYK